MTPFTENKKKQIEKSSFECTTLQPYQQKLLLNSIEHRNAVTISIRIPLQYVLFELCNTAYIHTTRKNLGAR